MKLFGLIAIGLVALPAYAQIPATATANIGTGTPVEYTDAEREAFHKKIEAAKTPEARDEIIREEIKHMKAKMKAAEPKKVTPKNEGTTIYHPDGTHTTTAGGIVVNTPGGGRQYKRQRLVLPEDAKLQRVEEEPSLDSADDPTTPEKECTKDDPNTKENEFSIDDPLTEADECAEPVEAEAAPAAAPRVRKQVERSDKKFLKQPN